MRFALHRFIICLLLVCPVFLFGLCTQMAHARQPRPGDQERLGPPVNLDLAELKTIVRKDMAPEEVLNRYPRTNGRLNFAEPIPYLMNGTLYPVDEVIRYLGAHSREVRGEGYSGYQTQERMDITFLFFQGKLKLFVVRHQVREKDDFIFTEHTTKNFLQFIATGADPGDFFPNGSCVWQLYRKLYMDTPPILEGHCYWDSSAFGVRVSGDRHYQNRLKDGYESQVDLSTLPEK